MASSLPIDDLLKPVSPAAPCGVLDDASEAQISTLDEAIKAAAGGVKGRTATGLQVVRQAAEGLFRGGKIPDLSAEPMGKTTVEVKAVKHLKAAMVLTLTALNQEGLAGFADGLTLVHRLLSEFWDPVLPVANPDDEEDPYVARVNILAPLSIPSPTAAGGTGFVLTGGAWDFLGRLLAAPLLAPEGRTPLTVRGAISAWATEQGLPLPPGEERSREEVHEVYAASAEILPAQREILKSALEALEGIDGAFQKVAGAFKPELKFLIQVLRAANAVLNDAAPQPVVVVGPGPTNRLSLPPPSPAPASSREEAIRKLVEVAEYFRKNERSSPIPLLLDRAKRLASMNFLELLEDLGLGKEAAPEFRRLAGISETPPNPDGSGG